MEREFSVSQLSLFCVGLNVEGICWILNAAMKTVGTYFVQRALAHTLGIFSRWTWS